MIKINLLPTAVILILVAKLYSFKTIFWQRMYSSGPNNQDKTQLNPFPIGSQAENKQKPVKHRSVWILTAARLKITIKAIRISRDLSRLSLPASGSRPLLTPLERLRNWTRRMIRRVRMPRITAIWYATGEKVKVRCIGGSRVRSKSRLARRGMRRVLSFWHRSARSRSKIRARLHHLLTGSSSLSIAWASQRWQCPGSLKYSSCTASLPKLSIKATGLRKVLELSTTWPLAGPPHLTKRSLE